jgi:hypothetical protein
MEKIIVCSECGKKHKKEDEDKTWWELLKGMPSCIDCDKKVIENVDKHTKSFTKKANDMERFM